MFVLMGSYKGGGTDSAGDGDSGSQDESVTEDGNQTDIDDYTGDDGGDDTGHRSGGGGVAAGSGGSADSGDDGSVITKPPDEEESAPDSEDTVDPEDDADDDDDEREDDDTVVVVQKVDPLSAMSWGVQPVMKRVQELYGDQVELSYTSAQVREFEDPEQAKQEWRNSTDKHGMPVDASFWDEDPPESTELVNSAFEAALEQGRGMDYLRAMWRHGIAAGQTLNNREILTDLASDIGLDPIRFKEDIDEAEPESGEGHDELPFTFMEIEGHPVPKTGRVRYSDFKTQFKFQGLEEKEPQELQGFVDEHGPVATVEVMEVYEPADRDQAIQRLENVGQVSSFEVGGERFWEI